MIRSGVLLFLPLVLLLCLFGTPVGASEPLAGKALKGRVQMSGSIVDTGCAMRVGNEGQTVTFKPAALHGLVRGDASFQQPFNIFLSGCGTLNTHGDSRSSPDLKLTFVGENNGQYFRLQGIAQGIALQIKNAHGKLITPGMLLDDSTRTGDALTLRYFLELVGTGSSLQAGNYYATITLSIQHL